jgi:hypothetical protein
MKMDMYPFHPVHVLQEAQKRRLRHSLLPIAIVMICLFLASHTGNIVVKIVPVVALLYYFSINARFRTARTYPPDDPGAFLAPITGRVKEVTEEGDRRVIRIVRIAFTAADLRTAHAADLRAPQGAGESPNFVNDTLNTEWSISSPPAEIFENHPSLGGMLIGIVPSAAECICRLPLDMELNITAGERTTAGETILARRVEQPPEPAPENE